MSTLMQDFRLALRALRRRPAAAALIVFTLAVGIGANAAMFGLIDRLLLSAPPHIESPDEVLRVQFVGTDPRGVPFAMTGASFPLFEDLGAAVPTVSAWAAIRRDELVLGDGASGRKLTCMKVSGGYFPLLRTQPRLGRFFGPADDEPPSGAPVVVVSDGFWRRHYAAQEAVLGQALVLGGESFTVIGVAPPGFSGHTLEAVDVWMPLSAGMAAEGPWWRTDRRRQIISIMSRLAPGVGAHQAASDMSLAYAQIATQSGDREMNVGVSLSSLIPARGINGISSEGQIALWLGGVSAIVLIIAIANVANFQLFRAVRRRRETAMRVALGVSRARLLSQLLTESLVLAVLGGAAGLVIASWGGELLRLLLLPTVAAPASGVGVQVAVVCGGTGPDDSARHRSHPGRGCLSAGEHRPAPLRRRRGDLSPIATAGRSAGRADSPFGSAAHLCGPLRQESDRCR